MVGDFEEGIIPDFQKWILQLHSENPDKRYEACEELRVAESIPDEAISALHETTNDNNPDVADAAQRALAMHMGTANLHDHPYYSDPQELAEAQLSRFGCLYLLILLGGSFVPIAMWAWWYTTLDPEGLRTLADLLALIGIWIGGQNIAFSCIGIYIGYFIYLGLLFLYARLGQDQDQK